MIRMAFTIHGQVQGVGFRPFVWRLAREEKLTGHVGNTSAGVRIEIQGAPQSAAAFARRLRQELPPLAKITRLEQRELPVILREEGFAIKTSQGHAGQNVLVSADVAVCADCLRDMADPANRRHKYAFTNCTNCGPRFSITRSIPYDRPVTTMACFPLCATCAAEYASPADRRFHAQPIACPVCGPQLWFVAKSDLEAGKTALDEKNSSHALEKAAAFIQKGGILALRGLGGFQLVCDARNQETVATLRRRKNRPHKALAVMMADIDAVAQYCQLTPEHEHLLTSPARPIVLCPLRPQARETLAGIAPDTLTLGVMLPYTPLHALLLEAVAAAGLRQPCLVMTSANPQGEPITLGNREALDRLASLADAWLLHNRDILCRIDDSVVAPGPDGSLVFFRRARGYVPEPVRLPASGPCVLGVGAELKATFCLTRGSDAFLGQHIGDLKHPACMDFYEEALPHLQRLLEVKPELIVHDLHPDFLSSKFARELATRENTPTLALQHHVAHAAACLAEHGHCEPALALCLDGSGLGVDGQIWGGELLLVDVANCHWQRLGGLSPFFLPGGEAAITEPWRIAAALRWQGAKQSGEHWQPNDRGEKIVAMLEAGLNCPATTSCGRLFDAIAAQLGLCAKASYEAQAPLRLEKAATLWLEQGSPTLAPGVDRPPFITETGLNHLDSVAIFARICHWQRSGLATGQIALAFHHLLANGFAALAAKAAEERQIDAVALSGGVLGNALLRQLLPEKLTAHGLTPLLHTNAGDGGLSLGQAFWGQRWLAARKGNSG